MQITSRAARQRLAVVAFTSLWLSACGGGGGGGASQPVAAAPGNGGSSPAAGTPASASGPAAPPATAGGPPAAAPPATAGGPPAVAPPPPAASPAPPAPALAPATASVFQSGDVWLTTSHAGEVQRYPRIARLTDGTYVAVRDSRVAGQPLTDLLVLMRKLDADGNPVGAETPIAAGTVPGVTALADGTFVVTWLAPPPPTFSLSTAVNGQRFDNAGAPIGGQMSLGSSTGAAQPTALADGTFVVATFLTDSHVSGPTSNLGRFAKDGTPMGVLAGLREDACGIDGPPSVAALPAGGFAVAWAYSCVAAPQVRMRVFDSNGSLMASSRMSVGVQGQGVVFPGLATLTGGQLALQWGLSDRMGLRELHTMVVTPTAPPDSPAGASTVPLQSGRTPGLVQSLAGGGFLIPWSAANDGEAQVPVSRYTNNGEPL